MPNTTGALVPGTQPLGSGLRMLAPTAGAGFLAGLMIVVSANGFATAGAAAGQKDVGGEQPARASAEVTSDLQDLLQTVGGTAESPRRQERPDATRPLSVEPGKQPLLPADRPAWVAAPPDLSSAVHRLFVGSELVGDPQEADRGLDGPLVQSLRKYIDEQITERPGMADRIDITADFIRKNLMQPDVSYVAELSTSVGPMYQKWVILEITPEQREILRGMVVATIQRERFAPIGLGAFGVLAAIALVHWLSRRRARRYSGTGGSRDALGSAAVDQRSLMGNGFALLAGLLALPAAIGMAGLAILVGWAHVQEVPVPRPAGAGLDGRPETVSASAVNQMSRNGTRIYQHEVGSQPITIRPREDTDE